MTRPRTFPSFFGDESPTIQNDLNHRSLAHAAIYARLNTKAVDHALQAQADRLSSMVQGPVVLPALTQDESIPPAVCEEERRGCISVKREWMEQRLRPQ